jgi:HSP20 family molecular chaperone IbpA
MLMPSIFGESLLDDFFGVPKERYLRTGNNSSGLMQTDIEESETGYALTMNLPGFKKEDVKAELKDGYLTINASTNSSKEEKDEKGKYIRKERYSGSCSRSFYVGEAVTQEDIKAKFEDGTLKISVPKKELKPEVEEAKYISIEG